MKIKSYFVCGPVKGICKQSAVWASGDDASNVWPVVYLQRPKWLTDDIAWENIYKSIRLDIPEDFEIANERIVTNKQQL